MEQDITQDITREKVVLAITELAKGIKTVSFYPPGHPALTQAIWKIVSLIEEIPPPEIGIEIEVTKNALLYQGEPFPSGSKAIADLNRELYYRRASKIIFLPNQKPGEMISFLNVLNRDAMEIQE
ncbi:MAG TPA: hypothetical protein VFU42_06110, partial [Candidatus Deferrimicrobiaceae bacterium]|nr:hypothetical protein [Candidatus Deferrimicrobiaceae bacterium]